MKSQMISVAIIILINFQIKGYLLEEVESSCGKRTVHSIGLINYGVESNEKDWPWHASIYRSSGLTTSYICGGTVINSNSILTAAHCVFENGSPIVPERVLVYLGRNNLETIGTNTQNFKVIYTSFKNNVQQFV